VFHDFCYAFSFINTVAELVEKEQHHPIFILCDIAMCKLIYTRAVDGLSENDFILAAKIDASVPNVMSGFNRHSSQWLVQFHF
jgi:4a-hydroxytetrahydrobiopterin dehydratase